MAKRNVSKVELVISSRNGDWCFIHFGKRNGLSLVFGRSFSRLYTPPVKFHDAVVSWPRSPGFFWLTFKRLKKKRAVRAGNGKEGGFLNHAVHH